MGIAPWAIKYVTFLWRAIRRPLWGISYVRGRFAAKDDPIHQRRVSEYQSHSYTLETAIALAAGSELTTVQALLHDSALANFWSEVKALAARDPDCIPKSWDASPQLAQISYCLCRLLQPAVMVETGVAHGITSAFILRALAENGKGYLCSVDLPIVRWKSESLTGIAVPEQLRDRWTLYLGDSRHVLPRLLRKVGGIDVFLHDSRHTYQHQWMEYSVAWPYLPTGGVLLSDDLCNDAFIEFAEAQKARPIVVVLPSDGRRLGLLVKP